MCYRRVSSQSPLKTVLMTPEANLLVYVPKIGNALIQRLRDLF
jgi:hypothetical protein